MSVLLRCPNCGTTKTTPGECEACQSAKVRYFCTNHAPGLWLDALTCPKCGAAFGESARRTSEPPPAPAPPVRVRAPSPDSVRWPASTSASRPPSHSRASPPADGERGWRRSDRLPAVVEEREPHSAPLAPWMALLRAAVRAHYLPDRAAPERKRRPSGSGAGGCVMRLLIITACLFLALVLAVSAFGWSLLQGF